MEAPEGPSRYLGWGSGPHDFGVYVYAIKLHGAFKSPTARYLPKTKITSPLPWAPMSGTEGPIYVLETLKYHS